jgi:hypothetical protein
MARSRASPPIASIDACKTACADNKIANTIPPIDARAARS